MKAIRGWGNARKHWQCGARAVAMPGLVLPHGHGDFGEVQSWVVELMPSLVLALGAATGSRGDAGVIGRCKTLALG